MELQAIKIEEIQRRKLIDFIERIFKGDMFFYREEGMICHHIRGDIIRIHWFEFCIYHIPKRFEELLFIPWQEAVEEFINTKDIHLVDFLISFYNKRV